MNWYLLMNNNNRARLLPIPVEFKLYIAKKNVILKINLLKIYLLKRYNYMLNRNLPPCYLDRNRGALGAYYLILATSKI